MQGTSYVQLSPKCNSRVHISSEQLHVHNILRHHMLLSYTVPQPPGYCLGSIRVHAARELNVTHGLLWDYSFCKRVTGLRSVTVLSVAALRLISRWPMLCR
jgi:hypothetical protein